MPRTRIKICGIRDIEGAIAACDAGADALGFIFVRSSQRYIDPEQASEIMLGLPPFVSTVGVFMNPSLEAFLDAEETCPTTHTQFHGNEPDELIRQCAPVIKALRYDPDSIALDLERTEEDDNIEAVLIDGPAPGEGVAFQWEDLAPRLDHFTKPVFLAGGLTPDNVGDAIRILRPFGVDVSSGVERERGQKDPELIEAFCDAVRQADQD